MKKPLPPLPPKPLPTFNLFVANLPFDARAKDLREFFNAGCRKVVSSEIIFHGNPRKSTGYGFVTFKTKRQTDEALSAFQRKIFMGRSLKMSRSRQFIRQSIKKGVCSLMVLQRSWTLVWSKQIWLKTIDKEVLGRCNSVVSIAFQVVGL